MNQKFNRDVILDMIHRNGSKIFAVEFVKKNGDIRVMQCHSRVTRDIKGEAAEERYRRAVKTRAENNPNLVNVWDVHKQERRSINLDTVISITLSGVTYEVNKNAA
jgi:hypothetical protein